MRRLLPITATLILSSMMATLLSACGSAPSPSPLSASGSASQDGASTAVDGRGYLSMPDRAAFLQTDARWAKDRLGRSSDTMASDGCLVTAVAMAVRNLGVDTDPKRLNRDLTRAGAFTPNGWLVWSGVELATDGQATAIYHDEVDPRAIRACMLQGQYPLVQFYLPSGRSHWAMIVAESAEGYRMRDPLRESAKPLIFPRGADAFRALRCVGPGPEAES